MRDQGPEGKLSAKTRMSYDEQLVEYVVFSCILVLCVSVDVFFHSIEAACKIVSLKTRNVSNNNYVKDIRKSMQ